MMTSEQLARQIRIDSVRMVSAAKASHLTAALSIADIVAVLFTEVLRYDPKSPKASDRDRFILSKGHAGVAAYSALARCGFFDPVLLETYCQDGSVLSGHVSHYGVPGVEFSTGSLGHGLPVGAGMAYALKQDGSKARVFVIIGDGESEEGTTWETALFAAQQKLDNLILIVDANKMQAMGNTRDICSSEPIAAKWRAFNWDTQDIDGNSHEALRAAFRNLMPGRPHCIVANTIKGKGVSFMEGNLKWHYSPPLGMNLENALRELEGGHHA